MHPGQIKKLAKGKVKQYKLPPDPVGLLVQLQLPKRMGAFMNRLAMTSVFLCGSLGMTFFSTLSKPSVAMPAGNTKYESGQTEKGDSFVYADFEKMAPDKRPLSNRDGWTQITAYQESTPPHYKNVANLNPAAPERVKLSNGHAAIALDYELFAPNGYAGVGVKVDGQAGKDNKPVADDLSAYKFLLMNIYVTGEPPPGVPALRVECESRGQGLGLESGFPQMNFRVKQGLNTYKIALKNLSQPSWVQTRVSVEEVLKKLTAVSVTAFCDHGCTNVHGMMVIQDIVFQK